MIDFLLHSKLNKHKREICSFSLKDTCYFVENRNILAFVKENLQVYQCSRVVYGAVGQLLRTGQRNFRKVLMGFVMEIYFHLQMQGKIPK